jgi:single-strand DNA-binding protein
MNRVILIGNLGQDPEVRRTGAGVAVANVSIATNESYKDRNGAVQERTDWHRLVMWRGLAEVAEKFLHKGDQVCVEGKLRHRKYESGGESRWITEIEVDEMLMLGGKGNGNGNGRPSSGMSSDEIDAVEESISPGADEEELLF